LAEAGININGSQPWDIQVHDDRFYPAVLRGKNLALGEAYMKCWWDCERIDEMICRILKCNLDSRVKGGLRYVLLQIPSFLFNLQSRRRAPIIAERHYDLGNDLFTSFLDPLNQYSCAYFENTDERDLERAQQNKLDLICRKIGLTNTDHVLDIGSGWGGFAKYAASSYGCTVTAVNISSEQIRYSAEQCKGLPVRILPCDYRQLQGTFDKIISIGMFEHVGRKNYREFMSVVHRSLKNDGIFLLHTIGGNESMVNSDPWIEKYIFPNGMLPSIAQIGKAIEGLFVMEDWHNLGPNYDKTLMAWNRNFQDAWPNLKSRYDATFKRMWEYYLLSCAGAFRARNIQLWQIVLTKEGTPQPARKT
jgi:cyclopropane-fatty-acyl-phospholipid synthase